MRRTRISHEKIDCDSLYGNIPIGVEMEIKMLRDSPFRWFWKWWCRIFGHKIETYVGGYSYVGYKNRILVGGRKGRERKFKYLAEGYCKHCGEHFCNTYIKKHKR